MALNTAAMIDAISSALAATGLFAAVNTAEPTRAPDGGHQELTAAVWAQSIAPHAEASGLAATSAAVTFTIRLYSNMLQEPRDAIDPALIVAVDQIMNDITGDFTLGGDVMAVDLMGMTGASLTATAGYLEIDGTLYRVMDITLPCIISNAWSQVA